MLSNSRPERKVLHRVYFPWDVGSCVLAKTLILLALLIAPTVLLHAEGLIAFTQSAPTTPVFDFVEITANVRTPVMRNPFLDGSITGNFEQVGSNNRVTVDGFCDSPDGSLYRVRFMPSKVGSYTFHVTMKAGQQTESHSGTFTATDQHLRGPLRVDPAYPWHFIWEGTGEHYFFNGTTAYWLLGWRDERTLQYSIDRLARLKVNRMRVSLSGRTSTAYGEAVMNGPRWNVNISPWPAQDVTDFTHPGFDYSRFDLAYWQKFDRMLRYARAQNTVISVVLSMNDERVHPAAGSEDEHRFIRYAAARLGGFFNITWDLGDDLEGFRDEKWTHETGMSLQQWDPYHHLATSHPMKTIFQDRASSGIL